MRGGEKVEKAPDIEVVLVTAKGYALRTTMAEFKVTHRGAKTVRALGFKEDGDKVVGGKVVKGDNDVVMVLTKNGETNIFNVSELKKSSRGNKALKAVTLKEGDEVVAVL